MDWKRKLTSRKFWVAVASFVSMLIVALGGSEAVATEVTALIIAGATVIAYIIGEGLVDASNGKGDKPETPADEPVAEIPETPADIGGGLSNPIGFSVSNKAE